MSGEGMSGRPEEQGAKRPGEANRPGQLDELLEGAGDEGDIRERAATRDDPGDAAAGGEPAPYSDEDVADEMSCYDLDDVSEAAPAGGVRQSLVEYRPDATAKIKVRVKEALKAGGLAQAEETAAAAEPYETEDVFAPVDGAAAAAAGAGEVREETAQESAAATAVEVPALAGTEAVAGKGTEAPENGAGAGEQDGPDSPAAPDGGPSGVEARIAAAVRKELEVQARANVITEGLVIDAVEKGLKEVASKLPTLDTPEIARLERTVGALEEHLRVVRSDETRRREVYAARWYKWPVRGAVAAGAVALLLAGAAGQARWGLIDGYGVVDAASDGWRDIVWREHGQKIAGCMKTAKAKNPARTCSVRVRVSR